MGRFSPMKRRLARSASSFRSTEGWKEKSKSSMVRRKGEAGEAQPGRQAAVGGGCGLLADHLGQVLDVAPLLGLGPLGQIWTSTG
jgi:hypothetical protein